MSLARSFLTLGSGTALSRLLGFARDIMIAASLGSGPVADAFTVAFRLPNLFRRLLSEGAFNTAFVPIYARIKAQGGDKAANNFASETFVGLFLFTLVLMVAAEIFMRPLVYLFAPGFFIDAEKVALTIILSRIAFPFLGFALLSALFAALLNAAEHYFIAAFAPVVLNLVLIAALALTFVYGLTGTSEAAIWLCIGVSLAGFVQTLWCLSGVWGQGSLKFRHPRFSQDMRRLLMMVLPGMLAGGITQINAFIGSLVGSHAPGVVAYLYYADRVYQLPLGIVSVALGLALLPLISRLLAAGDEKGALQAQNNALEFTLFLTLPAAVALNVAARPIVEVLFERGAFGHDATLATASALSYFALGLPAFTLAKALQPAFFAAHQMRAPMIIALVGAGLDLAISVSTFSTLAQDGIALGAALAGWFNAIALALLLWRSDRWNIDAAMFARLARMMLATIAMAAFLAFSSQILAPYWLAAQPLEVKLAALAFITLGGLALYIGLCLGLKCVNWRAWRAAA